MPYNPYTSFGGEPPKKPPSTPRVDTPKQDKHGKYQIVEAISIESWQPPRHIRRKIERLMDEQ